MEKKQSYRMMQTERGNEALRMFADFLEGKNGLLTVSIHESQFSAGTHSQPDIVFGKWGIEVKRVKAFLHNAQHRGEHIYFNGQLGNLYLAHNSWDRLKVWCRDHKKIPLVVAVITHGKQDPFFIRFRQDQIDRLQEKHAHHKGIHINLFRMLHLGEIWK